MSADFAQSETRLNLMRAFAGESQARNRYTFAAGLARRKNLYVLESVFTFTADQERAHAKVFYNLLEQVSGQNLQVDGTYPVELFPDILDHLRSAQHNDATMAPAVCPVCKHPQGYFIRWEMAPFE